MSKTNHRVNKDRPEKDGESFQHKARRQTKQKFDELIELYDVDPDALDSIYDEPEFEPFAKTRRKVRK